MVRQAGRVLLLLVALAVTSPAARALDYATMPVRAYLVYTNTAAAQTGTSPDKAFITGLNAGIYLGLYIANLSMLADGGEAPYCLATDPNITEALFPFLFVAYLRGQIALDQEYEERLLPPALYQFLVDEFPCEP